MKIKIKTRYARLIFSIIIVITVLYSTGLAQVAELRWPREIRASEVKIVMYQPQLESFKTDQLTGRAVVSVTPKGQTEPIFGVVWFSARISTDRDNRTVKLLDIDIPEVKFPNADPSKVVKLTSILKQAIMAWDITMPFDQMLTQLDLVEKEKAALDDIKSTPPKIIVVKYPAVLITIDGEPQLQKIENSSLMRVVNTPFFIVLETGKKTYYLKGGDKWFSAADIKGIWQTIISPPSSVIEAAKKESMQASQDTKTSDGRIPEIIIATEPAELIVIDGEPKYSPIFETDLLYITNTESDVFVEIGSQQCFVLLSGRWFMANSLEESKWTYVPDEKLPADFAKISIGSAKGHVLANVAGTQEAKEAVLETYIPQTATVKRSEAKVVVVYDGAPKFAKIENTDMYYALNTSYSVIRYGNNYYCCHDGVWFVASSPLGPWVVCVAVPQVIYTMPPSSPVFHVKYVYVYSHTPEVVYVGYTPGYVGCYVYGGTVVYGTGYVYPGWYHTYYYPRPATWGVAVCYNPHTGNWGFRVGYSSGGGWFVGGGYRGGRWGAGGYRDININSNINIDRSRNNLYNRRDGVVRGPVAGRPSTGRPGTDRPGTGRPGVVGTPGTGRPGSSRPVTTQGRRNNVYADRNGNVHRKTDKGWQQRNRSGWSESKRSTTQLDRYSSVRQRGTDRTNRYNRYRSSGSSRPSGGRSGGSRGRGRRR